MVGTLCFKCSGPGLIPGLGTKIPQAMRCGQKEKKIRQGVWHLGDGTHGE